MSYPSEGVAVQEACYPNFSTCLVDTFYHDSLLKELVGQYKASKYAVFGYVDSVRNFENYDTTWYRGEVNFIDTFTNERIHVSIHTDLKDSVPIRRFSFLDRWVAFTNNPLATTYTPLRDTPFVAFFDKYDSIQDLNIGPMDGCFFEPNVYQILDGRIRKKGLHGYRMPGVSVTVKEFLAAVGHADVPAPPVGIIRRITGSGGLRPLRSRFSVDALGRRYGPGGTGKGSARIYRLWGLPSGTLRETTDGITRPK
jgi:hypothetical protein